MHLARLEGDSQRADGSSSLCLAWLLRERRSARLEPVWKFIARSGHQKRDAHIWPRAHFYFWWRCFEPLFQYRVFGIFTQARLRRFHAAQTLGRCRILKRQGIAGVKRPSGAWSPRSSHNPGWYATKHARCRQNGVAPPGFSL